MQKGGGGGGRTQLIALIVLSVASLYLSLSFMELSKDVATMLRMRQMRGNYKLKPVKSYCERLAICTSPEVLTLTNVQPSSVPTTQCDSR